MYEEKNLITHHSVVALVATYRQAQKEITAAFDLLDQAKMRLNETGIIDHVLKTNVRDFDLCETEYFTFRWYKKGSLHIRFKRLDLVRRLNQLAGGNRLKND